METIITDEIIKGNPLKIESELKVEMANQLLKMGANDYENVCENMRQMATIFEILEENINEEYVIIKYNPMGLWYLEKESEIYE